METKNLRTVADVHVVVVMKEVKLEEEDYSAADSFAVLFLHKNGQKQLCENPVLEQYMEHSDEKEMENS